MSESRFRGGEPRVLLVDDEVYYLRAVERLLRRHKFSPLSVSSGELAIRALEQWSFSAVVADLKMPGVDGLQVLDRVNPRLGRILLTVAPWDVPAVYRERGVVVIDKFDSTGGLIAELERVTGRRPAA